MRLLLNQIHCRRGLSTLTVLSLVVVVAVLALGSILLFNGQDRGGARISGDLFAAQYGSFDIAIPASGELVAQNQIEIRNRLETRAVITEIASEGTYVRKGDVLMKLNDEELRNRIKDAEDALNSAETSLISAQANLAIRQSAAASELDRAQLNVELSKLALDAWRDGEVLSRRQQLRLALDRAILNHERLERRLEQSERLYEQEFISSDELERDNIARIEAEANLLQAEMDLRVYNEYTYQQQKRQKNSDVEQARAELERVQQRHEAEIQTAQADLASRRQQVESRRERLDDLRRQLEFTTIVAPADGLVVYASSMESQRWRGDPPQVGTELSRNQLVIVLPDTSRMVAAVKINEALSGLIRPGQDAIITSDAMPDKSLKGRVQSVGVLAETGGWRDPNRRDYTVRITIDETDLTGLRPSMRARSEILVDRVDNAVFVPIQAIFREGGQAYVYVPVRGGYEAVPVRVGRASELYVEIIEGLSAGDLVLLRRPQSSEIVRGPEPEPAAQELPGREEPKGAMPGGYDAPSDDRRTPDGRMPGSGRSDDGARPEGRTRPEGGRSPGAGGGGGGEGRGGPRGGGAG
jgi:HlyD family secretion protein